MASKATPNRPASSRSRPGRQKPGHLKAVGISNRESPEEEARERELARDRRGSLGAKRTSRPAIDRVR